MLSFLSPNSIAAAEPPAEAPPPLVYPAQLAQPVPGNPAAIPVSKEDKDGWRKRHEDLLKRAKAGAIDVLFIGDSITDNWEGPGEKVWNRDFAPLKAANFGVGGDRTEHLLWRIQNGECEGYTPKAIVLLIGTNNCNTNSAEQIAGGIALIVSELRGKFPGAKLLLMGVFPRSEHPDARREKVARVNAIIAKLDDGKQVKFLDIGAKFLDEDGSISKDVMHDYLHPTEKGYEIWSREISGILKDWLGK